MKRLLCLAVVPMALLFSGCSDKPAALEECVDVVAEHFGVSPGDVTLTESVKSPVGAYDWKGAVAEGTFACASPDGSQLTTALAFDSTGMPETLVAN